MENKVNASGSHQARCLGSSCPSFFPSSSNMMAGAVEATCDHEVTLKMKARAVNGRAEKHRARGMPMTLWITFQPGC
jgi:hypothetical protein